MKYRAKFNGVLAGVSDYAHLDTVYDTVHAALRAVHTTAWLVATSRVINLTVAETSVQVYAVAVANEAAHLCDVSTMMVPNHIPPEYLAKVQMITERGCVWPGPGMFFQIEAIPHGP